MYPVHHTLAVDSLMEGQSTMRIFTSEDGRPWVATLFEGNEGSAQVTTKFGWEAVLFEAKAQQGGQSLAFRPAGWLLKATTEDLLNALQESEWVRTRWDANRA